MIFHQYSILLLIDSSKCISKNIGKKDNDQPLSDILHLSCIF
ncbi:hypothetical protein BSPLISOX_2763 [uncultured Gammaproteobacteria bacterium]|nr:hypothetical protein BSPLISOX_2763 [uncultured Gammaproteobacteria bacterium]